jgi:putative membrane protein
MKRANSGVLAVFASIAVLALTAGLAHAQGEVPVTPRPRPVNPALFAPASAIAIKPMPVEQRDERRFLKDAAAAARFESEASRLALAKSSHAGVRSLATTLITHNTATSNELLHMLHVRGMAAPMLANDQRKILNRLAKLQGAKFDREFLEELGLKSQQENVHLFERASLTARDPQLKAWIDRTLPTLRHHLTTAERLAPPAARMARTGAAVQSPTKDPFVSRASLATRSMGGGSVPLRVATPAGKTASESSSR